MLHTGQVPDDVDGAPMTATLYRERVLPTFAWWTIVAALVAMVSIAYGAALGSRVGLIVAGGLSILVGIALVRSSPVIEVSASKVRCGKATLPRSHISTIESVDAPRVAQIRRGQDPDVGDRAYQVLPAWFARTALVLHVNDASDPHSAWVVATRHPARLEHALSTRVTD